MTCERCGHELHVGDFPFCKGSPADHAQCATSVIGDEMDQWQENGTPTPIRFRSKSDRRAWLKANGLVQVDTKTAKGTIDWASRMDPWTLENARVLVSRPNALKGNDEEPPLNMHITRVSGVLKHG